MDSEEQLSAELKTAQPNSNKKKNPYEENFNEIMRRENAMKQRQEQLQSELGELLDGKTPSSNNDDGESADRLKRIPSEYEFIMLSKAHLGLNPRSKHPATRVYGFFKTRKAALCHLNDLKRWGVDVEEFGDIHLAPRMKWVLIPSNKEKDQNAEYTLGKIEKLRTLHKEERERANRDFEANRGGKSESSKAWREPLQERLERYPSSINFLTPTS